MKPDGEAYYEYVLYFADDVLRISADPSRTMKQIQEKFQFKGNKWNNLYIYLGARIHKKVLEGITLWTMTSYDCLKAAVKQVEHKL